MDFRRVLTLAIAATLAACAVAPTVSLEAAPAPAPVARKYADFWEAALALDFESAERLAAPGVQREYAQSLREFAEGNLDAAQVRLTELLSDTQAGPRARALLAATARPGRGRLKVFLGMSPGVGKTYEMLRAARRRKAEGGDVVVIAAPWRALGQVEQTVQAARRRRGRIARIARRSWRIRLILAGRAGALGGARGGERDRQARCGGAALRLATCGAGNLPIHLGSHPLAPVRARLVPPFV